MARSQQSGFGLIFKKAFIDACRFCGGIDFAGFLQDIGYPFEAGYQRFEIGLGFEGFQGTDAMPNAWHVINRYVDNSSDYILGKPVLG